MRTIYNNKDIARSMMRTFLRANPCLGYYKFGIEEVDGGFVCYVSEDDKRLYYSDNFGGCLE